jgi:hypothetical protein
MSTTKLYISALIYLPSRPTGVTFEIPTKNVQTSPLPVQGDIVTFKYETNSQKSKLNKAVVFRVREDLTWKDVVTSFTHQVTLSNGIVLLIVIM